MKNKTFTPPHFRPLWLKLFAVFFIAASTFLWSCDKADEAVKPGALTTTQAQTIKSGKDKEDKDDKYKSDKTGQYVSKDVQVTGYEDGAERPTRPKYDAAGIGSKYITPCEECGPIGGGTTPTTPTSTFVSSEGFGNSVYPNSYYYNPQNFIQDLKITKGSSSSVGTLDGYYKINVDLNRGAGGQYIYLQFTRDPQKVVGSNSNPGAWVNDVRIGWMVPVRGIVVESQNIGPANDWPDLQTPPIEVKDILGYHCPDLNDGSGGKYIYAYQKKDSWNTGLPYVKEVGVIYGNSSAIQPPDGWERIPGDLNEGAGGDYIYFCVKYN